MCATLTRCKGLAEAIVLLILIGVISVAFAQTSNSKPTATGIDFRRTEALAWSVELDHDSPDALHDVNCIHVSADRYECVGKDASDTTRTLHVRVSETGTSWQTYDDADH